MKKIIVVLTLLVTLNTIGTSQEEKIIWGAIRPWNPKISLQYEFCPDTLLNSWTIGASYYLANWKGPVIEPGFRLYGKEKGNKAGGFLDIQLAYGNLTHLSGSLTENHGRWNMFGASVGYGHKIIIGKKENFRITAGGRLKFWSHPGEEDNLEGLVWFTGTGSPLDFFIRAGYKF